MIVMLLRLYPLALVMLAACQSTAPFKDCRLVGKWEQRHAPRNMFGMDAASQPVQHGNITISPPAGESLTAIETFEPDGSWLCIDHPCLPNGFHPPAKRADGVLFDDRCAARETRGRWTLVSDQPERIVIGIFGPESTTATQRTFEIAEAGVFTSEDDAGKYRIVRVKDEE